MKLSKLLEGIVECNSSISDVEIKDIKIDSRKVENGDMFIALKGVKNDGGLFVEDALSRGAKIVVGEENRDENNYIKVDDARKFYALVCKNFWERACEKLHVIGVTGTNGKTTTTNIIYQILQNSCKKTGIIGTFGAKWGEKEEFYETGMTTPDPYLLHQIFFKMRKDGCEYVVMEVSAHALALEKIAGINFDVGGLTNITEDHLDFFGDMDNYARAKFAFFERFNVKNKIVCGDDKRCFLYAQNSQNSVLKYGLKEFNDVRADKFQKDLLGSKFFYSAGDESFDVETNLVGDYNIQNTLAAIWACRKIGVSKEKICEKLKNLKQIDGRFNVIKFGSGAVVIDYAHTPDGLENILKTIKNLSDKKLVVVFGCGGDRDRKKRPVMGEIAARYADEIVVTSDNPRTEKPEEIIDEIVVGIKEKSFTRIADRRKAIEYAIDNFNNGETIVIAGKGAENYQEINGVKYHFSDYEIVENFIKNNKKS